MRPSGSFLVWLSHILSNGYLSYEEINFIFTANHILLHYLEC